MEISRSFAVKAAYVVAGLLHVFVCLFVCLFVLLVSVALNILRFISSCTKPNFVFVSRRAVPVFEGFEGCWQYWVVSERDCSVLFI